MKARILGIALVVGLAAQPAMATSVSIQGPAGPVTQGTPFVVDIAITGASDLVSFQFDLGFDASILSANAATEGPFLPAADGGSGTSFFPGFIDNSLGTITFVADALNGNDPGATGNGVLARVSFNALATGTSALTLSNGIFGSLLRDAQGELVMDDDPNSPFFGLFVVVFDEQVPLERGSATVAAAPTANVPEPGTLALIGTGLVAAVRRRSRSRLA